jgi:Ca2+-binding EF-hand superfamily protein
MRKVLAVAALAIALAPAAQAQPTPPGSRLWLWQVVAAAASRPPHFWTLKQMQSEMRQHFLASSSDGQRVTQADRELAGKMARTEARAQALQQWLRFDVNGDGRITRETYRALLRKQHGQNTASAAQVDQMVTQAFKDDRDNDGVLTFDEIRQAADQRFQQTHAGVDYRVRITLDFDTDHDGIVTIEEFNAAVAEVFAELDADHDGEISEQEARAFPQRLAQLQKQAELDARLAVCNLPAISPNSILATVMTEAGQGLSTVAIGSQDKAVRVVELAIEPGSKPITLVASSHRATIWRVTGAVERIERVIAFAIEQKVGVIGIARERISFPSTQTCQPLQALASSPDGDQQVRGVFRRAADASISVPALMSARLPSGAADATPRNPGGTQNPFTGDAKIMWDEMVRETPGGLVKIDLDAVVANEPAALFKVLPGYAGLAALIDDGTLQVVSRTRITRFMKGGVQVGPIIIGGSGNITVDFGPDAIPISRSVPGDLLITREMTIPADAGHMHGNFILGRGVPMPGNAASSVCIISEETGKPPTDKSSCR